jgi:hypothetical protein
VTGISSIRVGFNPRQVHVGYEGVSKIFRTDAVKIINLTNNAFENCPRPPSYVQLGTPTSREYFGYTYVHVDRMAPGNVSIRVLGFSPVTVISPMLHVFFNHRSCIILTNSSVFY